MIKSNTSMATIKKSLIKRKATKPNAEIKDSTTVVNIPSNLEIRKMIRQFSIPVKYCRYNIHQQADKIAVLLAQVTDRQSLKKSLNLSLNGGFVNLNSKSLQKLVRDYKIYIDWMVDQGILERNPKYIVKVHSKSFKLGPLYRGQTTKAYVLTDHTLIKKLTSNGNCNSTISKYPKLYHDLNSLDIEYNGAIEDLSSFKFRKLALLAAKNDFESELRINKKSLYRKMNNRQKLNEQKKLTIQKISSWLTALDKIKEKQFYFKQDRTSYRLHTSAVSIKKEMRKYLSINGQRLVACDIKNSQPYLSTALFLNPKQCIPLILPHLDNCKQFMKPWVIQAIYKMLKKYEKGDKLDSTLKYIELATTGKLYEFMAIELGKLTTKVWTREDAKLELLKVLFFPPKFKKLKGRIVMKNHFPEVLRFFSLLNYGFKLTKAQKGTIKGKSGPNILAILLQTMESEIVLNRVCKKINEKYPTIPLITLHDGIATTIGNQYHVQQIMQEELEKFVGKTPNIEIEWEKWGIGRYPG